MYPGTYSEFLWHKEHPEQTASDPKPQIPRPKEIPTVKEAPKAKADSGTKGQRPKTKDDAVRDHEARRAAEADRRKAEKEKRALQARIAEIESRIAAREAEVKELKTTMSAPGFYDDHVASKPVIDRHQALMWEVGDLMGQWEALQEHASTQQQDS